MPTIKLFECYPIAWVALPIVAGLAPSQTLPDRSAHFGRMECAQVNLVTRPLVRAMITSMRVKVDFVALYAICQHVKATPTCVPNAVGALATRHELGKRRSLSTYVF
ncbi:hypothetical protein [Burkholderia mayonis]|uniref:Uncharacterized protein n=1 Tax=Burkholderia mayonis TaxID=1385591 RepID=A0A1B4G238_9BURK|nr:hypothetical protein [Burkholderia mayonis]AOJ09986.1 hypothetical protein WS71_22260 [Burkholderia mayonis]KVE46872.1 hypothetical protein WS71_20220 [Burkholderia mayonis]